MSLRNQPVATRSNEDRWQAGLAFVTAVVNWLSKSADAKMRQIEARIHRLWTLYSQLHIRQQDGVGWNLTVAAGDVPPPTHYLRDLGAEAKALMIVNAARVEHGQAPLTRRPVSAAWQNLMKAAVAEQLLFKRNTPGYVMQCIARPLRIIATCVDKEPWELTVDDLRVAVRVGNAIQATGKLGDRVVGIVKGPAHL